MRTADRKRLASRRAVEPAEAARKQDHCSNQKRHDSNTYQKRSVLLQKVASDLVHVVQYCVPHLNEIGFPVFKVPFRFSQSTVRGFEKQKKKFSSRLYSPPS